ncbi:tetratricopeptide repeat protein [Ectothiorhodospira variabilis]
MRTGDQAAAKEQLVKASELDSENPEAHYNMGLLFYRLSEYERALSHAKEAYSAGYPLPGLRNLLEGRGYALGQ